MIILNTLLLLIALTSRRVAGQQSRNFFLDSNEGVGLSSIYNPENAALNNGVAYLNQGGLNGITRCVPLQRPNEYLTGSLLPNPQRTVKGPYKIVIQSQGQSRIEEADENGNVRGVVYFVDPQYGYPKTISYEGSLASGIRKSSFANPSQPFYPNRLVSPFLNSNDINQNNNDDDESMNVVNAIFNGKIRPNNNNPLRLSGSQQYLRQLQRLTTSNQAAPFSQTAQLNSLTPGQNFPGNFFQNVDQFWPAGQLPRNPLASLPLSAQTNPLQRLQLPANVFSIRPNMGIEPPQVLQQDPQSVSFGGNIQSRTAGDGSRGVINSRISWLGDNEQRFPEQEELDNIIPTTDVRNQFSNLVPNSFINQAGNRFQVGNLAGLTNSANVRNIIRDSNGFPLSSPLPRSLTQAVTPNFGQLSNVENIPNTQGNSQGRGQSPTRTIEESSSSTQESESGSQKSDLDYEVLVDIADKIAKLARSKNTGDSSASESS